MRLHKRQGESDELAAIMASYSDAQDSDMSERQIFEGASQPITVSHAFGEIAWLISQAALYQHLRVSDLSWFAMPALEHRQFHFFRDGQNPIGIALWANVSEVVEQKIIAGLGSPNGRLTSPERVSGNRLWLLDLIAPFATPDNRHQEIMFSDLIARKFKGKSFKMIRIDPETAHGEVVTIGADAGERLIEAVRQRATAGDRQ